MLQVQITEDSLRIGEQLTLSFHRTLRIPDDKRDYPLPPTFGRFPLAALGANFEGAVEAAIPIRNREALWIAFEGQNWHPTAIKVGLGTVNAIDAGAWTEPIHDNPQNYIVTDKQLWMDGVNIGDGHVRQFVAIALGEGLTVEEQVGGTQQGDLRIEVFAAKPGRFPVRAPPGYEAAGCRAMGTPPSIGLGAGGQIRQKIHADAHGIDAWDPTPAAAILIRLMAPIVFTQVTGRAAPPTAIDAATYTRLGLPWFELYEADAQEVAGAPAFRDLRSVRWGADEPADLTELRIRGLRREGS